MKAWLQKVDLESFAVELVELPAGAARVTVGRASTCDVRVDSGRVSRVQFVLKSDGGPWTLEIDPGASATFVNGARVSQHLLVTFDRIAIGAAMFTFLTAPPAHHAELEARIDEDPDDAGRVQVWADWLQEQGDPLGARLLGATTNPAWGGRHVEVARKHGLVHSLKLRAGPGVFNQAEQLLLLIKDREARWTRELTVDVSGWERTDRVQQTTAAVLRVLLTGPHLPRLERLSFGSITEVLPQDSFVPALLQRLPARFPHLRTAPESLLRPTRRAALEIVSVPAELDFHAPTAIGGRISLEAGLWVGSAVEGQLRALAPGILRATAEQSFLVRQEAPPWCFIPLEAGVLLNGRDAVETRLLPGDVIEEPRGSRFMFRAD